MSDKDHDVLRCQHFPFHLKPDRTQTIQAFSLSELLIVVSIIAVLAALTLPVIGMVRAASKGAVCASNQRQIYTAMLSYSNDNRGSLPAGQWGASTSQYISWDDRLSDYDGREIPLTSSDSNSQLNTHLAMNGVNPTTVKSYAMYTCAAETYRVRNGTGNAWARSYAFPSGGFPYPTKTAPGAAPASSSIKGIYWPAETPNVGANYLGGNIPYASDWAARINQITHPSSTILLAEIRHPFGDLGGCWGVVVDWPGTQPNNNLYPNGYSPTKATGQVNINAAYISGTSPLHGRSWNYLFADGHVERLESTKTVSDGVPLNANPDAGSMWMR